MVAANGYIRIQELLTKQCVKCGNGFVSNDEVRQVERKLVDEDSDPEHFFTVIHYYHEDCAKVVETIMEETLGLIEKGVVRDDD